MTYDTLLEKNTTRINENHRIDFLDGIRGWASLTVFLCHLLMGFLILSTPFLKFDKTRLLLDISTNNFIDISIGIILKLLTNARLAVIIFFVLSGYALSIGHLNVAKRKLALASTSRYFRLMIPILFTSLIAYILLKLNLMFNLEVASITPEPSTGWLDTFYKFVPNIKNVIGFSLYDVFFQYDGYKTYNSSLWTMPIEIMGSFLIYAYLGIFRTTEQVQWKLISFITVIVFFVSPLYSCFLLGYIIAEVNKRYDIEHLIRLFRIDNIELLFILIFVASMTLSLYFKVNDNIECVLASCVVLSVSYSKKLKTFFSNKLSKYLGLISFPLYLIHIPVICSWSSYIYLKLPAAFGIDIITSNLMNLVSTIFLCLISATLLLPMEKFSVTYSKKMGELIIKALAINNLSIIPDHGKLGFKEQTQDEVGPIPS